MAGYFGVKAEESVLQDMLGLFYCLKFYFKEMSVGAKLGYLDYLYLSILLVNFSFQLVFRHLPNWGVNFPTDDGPFCFQFDGEPSF